MSTRLTGQVLYPHDRGFREAWHGYNALHHGEHRPLAIAYCQDVEDVQNALEFAREQRARNANFDVRIRCGGHDYEGWSSNPRDGLVIDVSMMERMKLHREPGQRPHLADVGAGFEMQLLTERLWDFGVGLPLATSADVGIAGLTLGGGFGPTSRKWGLTCDHLEAVEIVLADGTVVEATAKNKHADLFWACKGAGGGNFGVVTRFRFRVRPVDKVLFFKAFWYGLDRLEEIVKRWQDWAPTADPGFTSLLRLRVQGRNPDGEDEPKGLLMVGQYTFDANGPDGPYDHAAVRRELHEKMYRGLDPLFISSSFCDHVEAARSYFLFHPRKNQRRAVREHSVFERYKAASSFAMELLDDAGIAMLRKRIEAYPDQKLPLAQPPMIQLLSGGGAVAGDQDGTALGQWRNTKFVLQIDGYWSAHDDLPTADDNDRREALQWVKDTRDAMLGWTRGSYIGYLDRNLGERPTDGKSPARFLDEYFEGARDGRARRLQDLKAKYDPGDLFRFPQGIPVPVKAPPRAKARRFSKST